MYVSSDGYAWSPVSIPITGAIGSPAYGAGKYVAVSGSGQIAVSTDATNWTNISSGFYDDLGVVAAAPTGVTVVVSGSSSTAYVSTNSGPFSPVSGLASPLNGVTYGVTNFVAVGGGALYTSTNGSTWTSRNPNTSAVLYSACYGNGLWVAVGSSGTVITSSNTLVWTLRTSPTSESLFGVTYANGQFVAVGQNATIVTSPDGINWTPQFIDLSTGISLYSVAAGNGLFVTCGDSGTIASSTNGSDWNLQSSGVSSQINSVAFGSGQFISFSSDPSSPFCSVLRSYDAVTWQKFPSPTGWRIIGVSFANGTFWAAGNNGTVLQSDVVSTQPLLAA